MFSNATTRASRPATALAAAAVAAAMLGAGLVAPTASAAESGDLNASNVTFQWGVNDESGGGSYFGGCNFLSAGEAGDNGKAGIWANDNTFYSAKTGNVEILKPTADGTLVEPTWQTKCTNQYGTSINGKTAGMTFKVANAAEGTPAEQPTYSGNVVRISSGSGTVNPDTDSAHIEWKGSFTIVYYGGMTYWSITDPVLDIKDGKGTITATASGYGADMDDASIWRQLDPQEIHIADLQNTKVDVTDSGITVTPDFLGVAVPEDVAGRNDQAEKTDANAAWWGSFPSSWLKFSMLTGQTSYWWTSYGSAKSIQIRKPASPITITYTAQAPATVPDAPAKPTATAASTSSVKVDWSAPANDGNSAITGYTVTLTPSTGDAVSKDVDADTTSVTFDGLTAPGVSYAATVVAKNAQGSSVPSDASDVVTPNANPSTDLGITVDPTEGVDPEVKNTFTVKGTGFTGGAAVYGAYAFVIDSSIWQPGQTFELSYAKKVAGVSWVQPKQITGGSFTATIDVEAGKLEYGKTYVVGTVAAHGLAPTDRRLDTATTITLKDQPVTPEPSVTVPSAVKNVTVKTAGVQELLVGWEQPEDNGGSAITGYTVTLTPQSGEGESITQNVGADKVQALFANLDAAVKYSVTVTAQNAQGSSAAAAAAEAVAPLAPSTDGGDTDTDNSGSDTGSDNTGNNNTGNNTNTNANTGNTSSNTNGNSSNTNQNGTSAHKTSGDNLSNTGVAVAGLATVSVLFAIAAGAVTVLRRRA